MKFKRTLLKSGSLRRLLSTVLAVTFVAGLLPVSALATGTGSAASVEYNRKSPEAAILNYYTGNSAELYKKIKEAAANRHADLSQYNAMTQVLGVPYNSTVPDGTYTWDKNPSQYWPSGFYNTGVIYADSQIRALSQVYGNLEVNISADFTNYVHTHTHRHGLNKYEYPVTNYTSVTLQMGSSTPVVVGGSYPENGLNYVRVGDYGAAKGNVSYNAENSGDSYGKVPYSSSDTFELKVIQNLGSYQDQGQVKSCTCGTNFSHADNMLLTFRDPLQPALPTVYYSLDGESWTPSTNGLEVQGRRTLYIKLSYNEPIRFADDSAAGKEALCLKLQAEGESATSENPREAHLYKLDGNELYFSYAFSESDVDLNIQTLDMSSLFPADEVSLVQVNQKNRQDWGNNGALKVNFTLDSSLKNSDGNTTGFSTTTCYITDLAGNALMEPASGGLAAGELTLDSKKPYVKNVEFQLTLNNGDVKQELGKTNPSDNTSYTDNSDRYLGVGDKVRLVLNMNERLKISTLSGRAAVATTNIQRTDNSFVTVNSQHFFPDDEAYFSDREITSWFMEPITMEAGWKVADDDGMIRVTALRFVDSAGNNVNLASITDQAGNPLEQKGDSVYIDPTANANPPLLDVTAPTVTAVSETLAPDTGGFCYAVSISDAESGVAGLSGKFVLRNGTAEKGGDGKNYYFEYAVSGSAETPVDTTEEPVWKTGKTGVAYPLVQLPTTYIHIRPKANEPYGSVAGCTFTVKTRDYAGNQGNVNLPAEGNTLKWYIDRVPPTVKAGGTTRTLKDNNSGGTLTANITLTDSNYISSWQYAWGENGTNAPTSGWAEGALSSTTSTSVTGTATADVGNGASFSQYLWVKATDHSNRVDESKSANTVTVCLGQYTYDLSQTQYNLNYSTGVTVEAKMEASVTGANDVLYFLVTTKGGTEYAVVRVDSTTNGTMNHDIFNRNNWEAYRWIYGCTLSGDNGTYTLTRTAGTQASSLMDQVQRGVYRGELDVVILSGKTGGVSGDLNAASNVLTLGGSGYTFSRDTVTLRTASNNQENFTGVTLTSNSDLGGDPAKSGAITLEHPARASLAGIEFRISIAKDTFDWNYDDVDWEHSYVELTQGVNSNVSYKFYLRPGQVASDGSTTQTLTIPEGDYQSGVYYAKLYIDCFAGYDIERRMTDNNSLNGNTIYFVVDNVQPVSDFSFALTYAPWEQSSNEYGIADFYGTLNCRSENGVITLPVADADGGTFGTGHPGQSYQFTVTSENEKPISRPTQTSSYGWYRLLMWNATDTNNVLTIEPTDDNQKTVKNNYGAYLGSNAYGFVFDESKKENGKYLYLEPNKENTVCIRKAYSNGTFSDIQTVRIKPVTQHITGEVRVDSANQQLVFTPDNPLLTSGARIYAWTWQSNQDPLQGQGTRIDMTPAADGTWRCGLVENGAMYKVVTVNSAGSICDAGSVAARAPWFDELDPTGNRGDNGPSGIKFTDNKDGTYQLEFQVRDDYNTIQNGLTLDIGFNDAYSTDHLNFTVKKGSNSWAADHPYNSVMNAYVWTETETSSTGLYSVEVGKYDFTQSNIQSTGIVIDETHELDYLYVTVKGCFKNVTGDMVVTVTATDALGNTGSVSTTQPVNYRQPVIYDENADSTLKPKLGNNGLILNFSQPVRPVNSWAWQEADSAAGFQTQWAGAFPIAGNGTYEVQFVDLCGNLYTQNLTVDAFTVYGTDYSMDLKFSNTSMNAETVALTATCSNGYLTFRDENNSTIWKKTDEEGTYIYQTYELLDKAGGSFWPTVPIRYPNGTPLTEGELQNLGSVLRSIRWNSNGKMKILCDTHPETMNPVYTLTVYISNIAPKTAPTAQVRYYACDLGQGFTQAELVQYIADNKGSGDTVTLTGNLRVWYETDRSVTPTKGGSEHLFTPENYTQDHTFTYVDELGHEGSVKVALPAGLKLAAPVNPPEDTTAPIVSVAIAAKRNGSYTQEGSFHYTEKSAAIEQKFAALGPVQGCLLTVSASDISGFTIAVSGDGAALSGNIVTITKAGEVTITVTDTHNNATTITFTVPPIIDTKLPEGKITAAVTGLYKKTLTITLTDKDDAGNDTGTVTLSLPEGVQQDGSDPNKYTYTVADNGTVKFEFCDRVGNWGTATYAVSGIDTEPPKLTVEWSPPLVYEDGEGKLQADKSQPTAGPVKTDVTARIKSDKAMHKLSMTIPGEPSTTITLLDKGKTTTNHPYKIKHPQTNETLVTVTAAPELITVTYSGNYNQNLTFTATTPNGKSAELTLNGVGCIDKTAPVIQTSQTEFKRDGASKPYAVKVTLTPNETVTSPNYGATRVVGGVSQPVQYDAGYPLILTFTEVGTHNVRFADGAGNVTIVPVVISNVDNEAPKLDVDKDERENQVTATVTVNEACTLTWGENGIHTFTGAGSYTITFTQNGTYAITATDDAGNESYKTIRVGSIDNVDPTITFSPSTIYVKQGDSDALTAALKTGYTVRDNMTKAEDLDVSFDQSQVKLNQAGEYTVTYTVEDKANNVTTANRFVRVIGSDTVCLNVDGNLILPDSTVVLRTGEHTLTVENNRGEPYSVKARKGVLSAGQMKYLSGNSLSFDQNGNFSVTATGFYTLLVTTQSRQTIRILLYVEQ